MADDVNFRILDDIHQPLCILPFRASLIPRCMNAGYGNVEPTYLFISQVKASFRVEDIDLAPHQQPYTVHLTRNHEHILEIQRRASTWHTWPMFGDSQHLQSHVGSGLCHLLQTAVGMTRCHRMCMCV